MEHQREFEARGLVREYSWEVPERLPPSNEAFTLGQLINREATRGNDRISPWRRFFEAEDSFNENQNPAAQVIAVEASRLRDKWLQFIHSTDKADKLDLTIYEPTVQGSLDMIKDIKTAWDTKRKRGVAGKCLSMFHKSCDTLYAHRNFLEVIPEGSVYVSILAGTLTTVIKASINHEKVAQGLSEALEKIDRAVLACSVDMKIFESKAMVKAVADLYAHVFLFLSSFMDWFMKKRFSRLLDSFNENLFEKFEAEITAIETQSVVIQRLAQQSHHAEGRATRLGVDHLQRGVDNVALHLHHSQATNDAIHRDLRLGLEGQARIEAELNYFNARNERLLQQAGQEVAELRKQNGRQMRQLNEKLNDILREAARLSLIRGQDVHSVQVTTLAPSTRSGEPTPIIPGLPLGTRPAAQAMAIASRHLEDFLHRDRVRLDMDVACTFSGPLDTLTRIKDWATTLPSSPSSNILWINGAATLAEDIHNPLTVLSSQFIDIVSESDVPVMSYFCHFKHGERLRLGNPTQEAQALIGLLYALIRQAIEILLPILDLDTEKAFPAERFRALDGTMATFSQARALFEGLLAALPRNGVFCVIDGLHWLDDQSTDKELLALIRTLGKSENVRVLFTTTGQSGALMECVDDSEVITIDEIDM